RRQRLITRYMTKNMLAIIRSLEEWRAELEGLQREEPFDILTDHRALEYFMTTKRLNPRQVRWAEFLSRFHFLIRYRPGKRNMPADALSRQEDLIRAQRKERDRCCTQALLRPEWLEDGVFPKAEKELLSGTELLAMNEPLHITDQVRQANRDSESLHELREKSHTGEDGWKMSEGLLTYQGRLVVPDEGDLRARLLDEVHRQPSTAHPGRGKTRGLIKLSTSHHPQTDGQTEIVNQYMAQRLRPFVSYYQDNWSELLPMMDFAAAVLPHESTGLSPFAVDRGYEPRVSFDWTAASPPRKLKLERKEAQNWLRHMENIWKLARTKMEAAQHRQKTQADRHRREVDFGIGDWVMVTTRDWKTERPSRKLADQAAGPYQIIEKVGNSFKLNLPDSIRVHPVFAPEKLRRATSTEPLQGQIPDAQPPIEVNGQDEWEVEQILASKLRYGKLYYRVKWIGYDDDPKWYPANFFKNAPLRIRDFHAEHPDAPGPPIRLPVWLKAAEDDEHLEDHTDDDRAQGRKPKATSRRPQTVEEDL
ncbi:Retrovirus polyprotein, partial [Rasamsonia emersonii CBS 393.64]